jgi:hypothetical protein
MLYLLIYLVSLPLLELVLHSLDYLVGVGPFGGESGGQTLLENSLHFLGEQVHVLLVDDQNFNLGTVSEDAELAREVLVLLYSRRGWPYGGVRVFRV